MENFELFVRKIPHYWKEIEGGKVVFFCLPVSHNQMYFALPDEGVDLAKFYEVVGQIPETNSIECSYASLLARGLCQSPNTPAGITAHAACANCEKRIMQGESQTWVSSVV